MHSQSDCAEMELLLQADLDGELDAASAARLAQHLAHCEHCARLQTQLIQLRGLLHERAPRFSPNAEFAANLRAKLQAVGDEEDPALTPHVPIAARWKNFSLLGAGAALAASLMLALTPMTQFASNSALIDSVVAEHVRSLQADHLLDVVSSDQHTVRPWFNGKLDFAPPVNDFAEQGFALVGGRLDYLAGRPVAALVYRHGQHPINLFVWPNERAAPQSANCVANAGYYVCSWRNETLNFWAISDANAEEMQKFSRLWL